MSERVLDSRNYIINDGIISFAFKCLEIVNFRIFCQYFTTTMPRRPQKIMKKSFHNAWKLNFMNFHGKGEEGHNGSRKNVKSEQESWTEEQHDVKWDLKINPRCTCWIIELIILTFFDFLNKFWNFNDKIKFLII